VRLFEFAEAVGAKESGRWASVKVSARPADVRTVQPMP
jgi:hypothetical protein